MAFQVVPHGIEVRREILGIAVHNDKAAPKDDCAAGDDKVGVEGGVEGFGVTPGAEVSEDVE